MENLKKGEIVTMVDPLKDVDLGKIKITATSNTNAEGTVKSITTDSHLKVGDSVVVQAEQIWK